MKKRNEHRSLKDHDRSFGIKYIPKDKSRSFGFSDFAERDAHRPEIRCAVDIPPNSFIFIFIHDFIVRNLND